MKKIFLHGVFKDHFDEEWELNVASPLEAVDAIDANTDGRFRQMLINLAQDGNDFAIASIGEKKRKKISKFLKKDKFDENLLKDIFCNEFTFDHQCFCKR